MPVHRIISDSTHVQLWVTSSSASINFDIIAMFTEQGGDNLKVAALIKQQMQDAIDVRIKRSTLPVEDEARQSDPNRPNFFWDGPDLVARSVIVEDVVWDGTRYSPALRRAR